jgi:hypothetical protein
LVGRALEGIKISGITRSGTGLPFPFEIFGTVDNLHTGLSDRANYSGSSPNFGISTGTQTQNDGTTTAQADSGFSEAGFLNCIGGSAETVVIASTGRECGAEGTYVRWHTSCNLQANSAMECPAIALSV